VRAASRIVFARSCAGVSRQPGKAAYAEATAFSTSAASPSAASPSASPVAGLATAILRPATGACQAPP
jgi:hypothetical protein